MNYKALLYSTSLGVLLCATGCKKDKFNINENQDDITESSVTTSALLPAALQATSDIVSTNWTFMQMWMGYWARSGSYQSQTDIETYRFTNNFQQSVWNDLYANAKNYDLMQKKAEALDQGFYDAVGRIMRSHNFQILVDVYNNVPYFNAFKGTAVPTPAYDNGIDIYRDLFKQLDTAVSLLQGPTGGEVGNPDSETADFVYEGDSESWIRFANTLRLRMILHLHNGMNGNQVVPGIDIAEQLGKITGEGFINAGQSAHLNPGFSASKPQPFFRVYNTDESGTSSRSDDVRANAYAINYYDHLGDPRLDMFYTEGSAGHLGIPFGTPAGDPDYEGSDLSTVRGPGLSPDGAASRAWIITSVESLFLQAEARQRGLLTTGPSAAELLTAAVQESFEWLGLTAEDANDYLNGNVGSPDVDYTATGGGLFTILSQKWFALNAIAPFEIWTDYRRTNIVYGAPAGFDAGPPISIDPGNTATSIPVRLFYPQNEYNYNAENVAAQGTIDVFTSKIFWDLN
ncbi:MAG TPA: SusD/RagB family nutrient-binding outer membrane lipoprotein [Chitinophagaceae bacterium]